MTRTARRSTVLRTVLHGHIPSRPRRDRIRHQLTRRDRLRFRDRLRHRYQRRERVQLPRPNSSRFPRLRCRPVLHDRPVRRSIRHDTPQHDPLNGRLQRRLPVPHRTSAVPCHRLRLGKSATRLAPHPLRATARSIPENRCVPRRRITRSTSTPPARPRHANRIPRRYRRPPSLKPTARFPPLDRHWRVRPSRPRQRPRTTTTTSRIPDRGCRATPFRGLNWDARITMTTTIIVTRMIATIATITTRITTDTPPAIVAPMDCPG